MGRESLPLVIDGPAALQQQGQVQAKEHSVRVLEPRQSLTGADRTWAEQYQAGDVLRYSRGSKVLGIKAGEYATVTAIDGTENRLTVERQDGSELAYDPRRLQGVSVYREAQREFAEGDRVQFTAPSRELNVANRELGTVSQIDNQGHIVIKMDSGKLVEFDISEHPHLDYGYTMTSHSSQGQTTDRVLIHADTEQGELLINTRMAYVAVSRARYDAQIYTDNKEELAEHLSREHSHSTAIDASQEHSQQQDPSTENQAESSSINHEVHQDESYQGHQPSEVELVNEVAIEQEIAGTEQGMTIEG